MIEKRNQILERIVYHQPPLTFNLTKIYRSCMQPHYLIQEAAGNKKSQKRESPSNHAKLWPEHRSEISKI